MKDETLAPVLRVGDAKAAITWYQRLGFELEWEHSSGPTFSLTTAIVKRGSLVLILSNREDAQRRADSLLHLRVVDVGTIATEIGVPVKNLQFGGLIGRQVELKDPDGNRICVAQVAPAPPPPQEWPEPSAAG